MSSTIELAGVRQVFDVRDAAGRRQQFVALDALDLTVRAGELFVLVGPSGCGKSTVLDLISGLTRPAGGTVRVGDHEVAAPGLDRGFVFQHGQRRPHAISASSSPATPSYTPRNTSALQSCGGVSR